MNFKQADSSTRHVRRHDVNVLLIIKLLFCLQRQYELVNKCDSRHMSAPILGDHHHKIHCR